MRRNTASFAARTRTPGMNCPPEVEVAVQAIQNRLTWPSIHWGVEGVSPDAWPHIAAAVLDAIGHQQLVAEHEALQALIDSPDFRVGGGLVKVSSLQALLGVSS